MKTKLLLSLVALLFVSVLYLLYLNLQKPSPTIVSIPTPTTTSTKTTDFTADWKTYENKELGISFQYPAKYKYSNGSLFDTQENSVYTLSIDNNPNNLSFLNFELLKIKENQKSESGEGYISPFVENNIISPKVKELNLPNIGNVYFRKNGPYIVDIDITTWLKNNKVYYFSTFSENNNSEEYDQILSTFKFTSVPTPTTSIPKITYKLPNGWQTITDLTGKFSVGYNPQTQDISTEYGYLGVVTKNLTNNQYYSPYSSTITFKVFPYNNGSRHSFIETRIGEPISSGNKNTNYSESNMQIDAKNCLVIQGLQISMGPSIHGMCAINSNQAVYFTAFDYGSLGNLLSTLQFN